MTTPPTLADMEAEAVEGQREARDAFAVHAALLKAERDDPTLSLNPRWQIIRADAYEAFRGAFKALS